MEDLNTLRNKLDELDDILIGVLAARFALTHQVGLYKREHGLPPTDRQREHEQMNRIGDKATQSGLNPDFAQKILRTIIDEVVERHATLQETTS